MMKILKLNAISPVADDVFKGYEYSDKAENPDGIILRSFAFLSSCLSTSILISPAVYILFSIVVPFM